MSQTAGAHSVGWGWQQRRGMIGRGMIGRGMKGDPDYPRTERLGWWLGREGGGGGGVSAFQPELLDCGCMNGSRSPTTWGWGRGTGPGVQPGRLPGDSHRGVCHTVFRTVSLVPCEAPSIYSIPLLSFSRNVHPPGRKEVDLSCLLTYLDSCDVGSLCSC